MASTPDVVALIGNPRSGSRTRGLADAVVGAVLDGLPGLRGVEVLELAELVGVTFGPEPARGSGALDDPLGLVRSARLLVVATPTYKGTYTGLLKIFLDRLGHRELAGVLAVPVAVAASPEHRHSVGAALHDLLVELGASVPAPPLAVLEADLAAPDDLAADWVARHRAELAGVLAAGPVAAA